MPTTSYPAPLPLLAAVVASAWSILPAQKLPCPQDDSPRVEVFLPPPPTVKMTYALNRARSVASQIYAGIGVTLQFRSVTSAPAACSRLDPGRRTVIVAFTSTPPRQATRDALAFALPFADSGACVTILLPRINGEIDNNPSFAAALLGHALAHEIAHYLQGALVHSDDGLMKSRWSSAEYRALEQRPLGFSPSDASWIRGSRPLTDAGTCFSR